MAGGLVLACLLGPVVEETCKLAGFRLLLRPRRHGYGWRPYAALGLTFGLVEGAGNSPSSPGRRPGTGSPPPPAPCRWSPGRSPRSCCTPRSAGSSPGRDGGRRVWALPLVCLVHAVYNSAAVLAVLGLTHLRGEAGAHRRAASPAIAAAP